MTLELDYTLQKVCNQMKGNRFDYDCITECLLCDFRVTRAYAAEFDIPDWYTHQDSSSNAA